TITAGSTAGKLTISDPASGATTTILVVSTFTVDNSAIFWCPYSWRLNGSSWAQTSNCGPYFKTTFSGTACFLTIDVSPLTGGSVSAALYPTIRYSVDNGAYTDFQLTSSTTQVTLASGLTNTTHTLYVLVNNEGSVYDR